MKYAVAFAVLFGGIASASATVVTFDDLSGSGSLAAGYAGFTDWGSWNYYDSAQPPYNPESGLERCYVGSEASSHIHVGRSIVFDGAYFAGHGSGDGFSDVFFNMYLGGNLVATSGTIAPTGTPAFLASGYSGPVDEVAMELTGGQTYGFQVMDNFTYHEVSTPEPASLAALGLGALVLIRRRRTARK